MSNVLAFPTPRESLVSDEQQTTIHRDYLLLATALERLRDRLVSARGRVAANTDVARTS